jgi:hypothetical protein
MGVAQSLRESVAAGSIEELSSYVDFGLSCCVSERGRLVAIFSAFRDRKNGQ